METSQCYPFYANQTIFITGATGSLGKVLLEKLLYADFDLRKIYLLVRPKKGKPMEERFAELRKLILFRRLEERHWSKVNLIRGDCDQPRLGVSEHDRQLLIDEVTMVIHLAANVRFDQPIKLAANNLKAVIELAKLTNQMTNLRRFVHISTAFSNCNRKEIGEEFYEPPIKYDKFLKVLDALDDVTLNEITPNLLGGFPNTYNYIKCTIEDFLRQEVNNLVIVRPAIIISTLSQPVPGYMDNFYGPMGITMASALGVLKSCYGDPENIALVVPSDYVANLTLTVASVKDAPNGIIYNYAVDENNNVTWGEINRVLTKHESKYPFSKKVWHVSFVLTKCQYWHALRVFLWHTCFSRFADLLLICMGREPIAVKNYQKLDKTMEAINFFIMNRFKFHQDNVTSLWNGMSDFDRYQFPFDMSQIDWKKYLEDTAFGGRIYLMKDPLDTLPQARKKARILFVVHYVFLAVFFYLVWCIVSFLLRMFVLKIAFYFLLLFSRSDTT